MVQPARAFPPPELVEDQYDVLLLYSETNEEEALKLKLIFEKFITLDRRNNPHQPSICMNSSLTWVQSEFCHLEEAMKRSTYMFLLVTENFRIGQLG